MDFYVLKDFLDKGKSINQIAKITNKGTTTIRYWLKKYNLKSKYKSFKEEPLYQKKIRKPCLSCKKEINKGSAKYCSLKCQKTYHFNQRLTDWIEGTYETKSRNFFRRYLTETQGYECSCCNISEWNGKSIVLEIDHIDGNSENNRPENLRFICPNCHSQTDTYKARNIGKGRHYRRERYAAGQSY
jgi:Zn finger protein HypA/HybF involved in hydrogenase expression